MMRKTLCLSALILVAVSGARAQNSMKSIQSASGQTVAGMPDSLKTGWTVGGLLSLNFAQGSSSNWAAGAQTFTMSLATANNFWAIYRDPKNSWDNGLTMDYGFTQTTSTGLQKTSDLIDLLSRYGRRIDSSKWYFSAMFDFRSQFTNGYSYGTSVLTGKDSNTLVSSFVAPAYILISPGFEYKPTGYFTLFISPVSSRITVCTNQALAPNFGIDSGKAVLYQFGAFASATFNKAILKNVNYTGRLDLYTNYLAHQGDIDVYSTNQLTMKINKYLNATYSLAIIYDDLAFKPNGSLWGTQVQSLLAIGLAVKL